MSWSNAWVGKPSAIARAIDAYSEKLTGPSKEEYDNVKDGLKVIVGANSDDAAVHVDANGHAYDPGGGQPRVSQCNCSIRKLGALVE